MNDCKVSIIVPVYNVEKYLKRCLESIVKQTYNNIEIILVDDGSIDQSGTICDNFAKLDNRIKVIHKKNEGLSITRKIGLDLATGKYISFIDSDDFIKYTYIEVLICHCLKYDAQIAQCDYFIGTETSFKELNKKNSVKVIGRENIFDTRQTKILLWGKIFDKKLFVDIEFPFNKKNEDEFITYKALYSANKIVLTNEKLYYYYQSKNSLYRSETEYYSLDVFEAYEERIEYFTDKKDNKMIEISKKELCIRCMIYYIKCNLSASNKNNKTHIFEMFRSYFNISIKSRYTSHLEKAILLFFNFFPRITIFAVRILDIHL